MRTGIELIQEERTRQVQEEGWTPEHDEEHGDGELALAAACYAIPEDRREAKSGDTWITFRVSVAADRSKWPRIGRYD